MDKNQIYSVLSNIKDILLKENSLENKLNKFYLDINYLYKLFI